MSTTRIQNALTHPSQWARGAVVDYDGQKFRVIKSSFSGDAHSITLHLDVYVSDARARYQSAYAIARRKALRAGKTIEQARAAGRRAGRKAAKQ